MIKRRYIAGFDGLRAIAVIGVLAFHLMPSKIVGGWLGVPLFFVLSGYLITDILIQEYDQNHFIAPLKFYMRRLKRLYPALVGMLLMTTTVILLFDQQLIYNLRRILLANLVYLYNFWAISNGESYFQQFGGASPFTHLWSLSIEGQYYFIWPFVVWGVLKCRFKREYVALTLFLLSIASAALMAIYYQPENINRAYYGTDTRLFAILLGSSLAFAWPSSKLQKDITVQAKKILNNTGLIVFLIMISGFLWLNGQQNVTYYGLMYLFTVAIAVLIGVIAHPASWFSKALNNKYLNYIGTRSYSIYLYQLPVFVFYEKFVPNYKPTTLNLIIEVILVLIVSELSYRYVENSFRYTVKIKNAMHRLTMSRNLFFGSLTLVLIFILFIGQGVLDPRAGQDHPETKLQKKLKNNQSAVAKQNAAAEKKSNTVNDKTTKLTADEKSLIATYGLKQKQYIAFKDMPFKAIGDSVMLDAAPFLQEINKNMVVDAEVGRQSYETPKIVDQMAKQGKLAPNMLIGLGTNGEIKRQDLDHMMKSFGSKRQIYWMNNFVQSRPWQNDNNNMLADAAKDYKNLHVIDWFGLAEQHVDWFADDGVHPGAIGDRQYVRLLVEEVGRVKHID
ncbi:MULTISPECIES: acyltransferase family protein [Leuconostoc]|uniref:Acyltransferase (Putative) n=2 Tax=Leuconostoc kimchii TaxID=136609 RepID=D5T1E1_LEUKI|nr:MULTISPECIES: acyltransferase family protein [Leuconostoc]ADG40090.1 acyltransferase (putative) [Leuconostoc kimchii IMSNU 11154]AEJ30112.1 acyltransferase (putative) [Leuconostoc sp. C2]QBR47201.1 acetyltransferase [Leuconostoc kimchii]